MGPIWSNPGAYQFGHRFYMSSVLLQFGQLTLRVYRIDQFGHILVHTNLVTLCTYIPSTIPIWSADTSCSLNSPIWSKIQLIEKFIA